MATHDVEVVDYSGTILKMRRYVRSFEEAVLRKDWDFAIELSTLITVESRLLKHQVKLLSENDGIPYQVELQQPKAV
jgi:hypothetical protein